MNPAVRITLNVTGTLCVFLGILGAVLPLLPATPFLLLASACYVRSSERLYGRLVGNRYLGTYIAGFRERKGLPLKAKIYTILLLWGSLLASAYRLDSAPLAFILIAIGVAVTTLILSIKTLKGERRGS